MSTVNVRSGSSITVLPSTTTGNITGGWVFKEAPKSAFQGTIAGTGASCTITIQASNDGVNAMATSLGTISLSTAGSTSDGFTTDAPWKYVRAVVSGSAGSITSISVVMGV